MRVFSNKAAPFLAALLFCFSACAFAANHYIRDGGTASTSGTGSCTGWDTANACDTLPATLVRGDTYYIADGTYPAKTFSTAASGTTVITVKKATEAAHGTDVGWVSTYGDGQALWGNLTFSSPYWQIDGVTGGGPGAWNTGFGFRVDHSAATPIIDVSSSADFVTLRHIEIRGTGNSSGGGSIAQDCIAIHGATDFLISYFYSENCGRCFGFFVPSPNAIIEYGYVGTFTSTGAAHAEVVSAWAGSFGTHLTFRYNIFTHIEGTGGLMFDNQSSPSAQLRVYGNVFYHAAGATWEAANGLIGGWTGGGGEEFHNARVYNNTFIDTETGGSVLSGFPNTASGNEARNNLFYSVGDVGDVGGVWGTVTHNHFISTTAAGTNTSTGTGNPFVDMTGLDFHLTSATPAGTTLAAPYNVDMYGAVRGADGTWDRGAVEFGPGGLLPAPTNLRWSPR